jgi:hypothetical protein
MRFNGFGLAMIALEDFLNRHIGTSADFNHDHVINFNDLVLLAQNYNGTFTPASPIPAAPADFARDLAAAFASVPEPSVIAMLPGCAFGLFGRRRRH